MRSLLARIFLSFWLIIGVTIGCAAIAGFWYAERIRDAFESFSVNDTIVAAGAALESDGRAGLVAWLEQFPESGGVVVFVIDEHGSDLLGRPLPRQIRRLLDRHRRFHRGRDYEHREPRSVRRARPVPQLVGANGDVYSFVAVPARSGPLHWAQPRIGLVVLLISLIVSAAVSYLLAGAITRPVRRLRDATVRIAGGDLGTRVGPGVGGRRDEIGLLARDFDQMADRLGKMAAQQVELARNISHELRSPLARLRVALELARRNSADSAQLNNIEKQAEKLDALIGQILSYSRFDAAPTDDAENFDIATLLRDVVDDVNFEGKTTQSASVIVTPDSPESMSFAGYRAALVSAVENVIRNAVRHSPVASAVEVSLTVAADASIVIAVSDQGDGVEEDELERLFEPFYRTQKAQADAQAEGTGLGLAIARRAVELNGGSIAASNLPTGGLQITMRFPRD